MEHLMDFVHVTLAMDDRARKACHDLFADDGGCSVRIDRVFGCCCIPSCFQQTTLQIDRPVRVSEKGLPQPWDN